MALKIRLQRHGTRHAPVYRMVVAEDKSRRDGRFVELLGTYAPQAGGQDVEFRIDLARADYWVGVGAKPPILPAISFARCVSPRRQPLHPEYPG